MDKASRKKSIIGKKQNSKKGRVSNIIEKALFNDADLVSWEEIRSIYWVNAWNDSQLMIVSRILRHVLGDDMVLLSYSEKNNLGRVTSYSACCLTNDLYLEFDLGDMKPNYLSINKSEGSIIFISITNTEVAATDLLYRVHTYTDKEKVSEDYLMFNAFELGLTGILSKCIPNGPILKSPMSIRAVEYELRH